MDQLRVNELPLLTAALFYGTIPKIEHKGYDKK